MDWKLEEAISYYKTQGAPRDHSALAGLLREVQRENGGNIPASALTVIAEAYGVKETYLMAVIKRISGLRIGQGHCLELCAGPNCGKHAALAKLAEALGKRDLEKITVKFMPCMRMCGKGPNVKWDGKLYHHMTEEKLRELMRQ